MGLVDLTWGGGAILSVEKRQYILLCPFFFFALNLPGRSLTFIFSRDLFSLVPRSTRWQRHVLREHGLFQFVLLHE